MKNRKNLEPFDHLMGPIECSLPDPVAHRLRARAIAGHLVRPDGQADIGALLDAALSDRSPDGYVTMEEVHQTMHDPCDPDVGRMMKEVMRTLLIQDGRPDLAATIN